MSRISCCTRCSDRAAARLVDVLGAQFSGQLVRPGHAAGLHRSRTRRVRVPSRRARGPGVHAGGPRAAAHRRRAQASFHRSRQRAAPHAAGAATAAGVPDLITRHHRNVCLTMRQTSATRATCCVLVLRLSAASRSPPRSGACSRTKANSLSSARRPARSSKARSSASPPTSVRSAGPRRQPFRREDRPGVGQHARQRARRHPQERRPVRRQAVADQRTTSPTSSPPRAATSTRPPASSPCATSRATCRSSSRSRSKDGGAWLKGSATLKRLDFGVGQGEWKDTETVANDVKVRFALLLKQ